MKMILESKVKGAVAGRQADDILLYTTNVNPHDALLFSLDHEEDRDYASFAVMPYASKKKTLFLHWQPGMETFFDNGRSYCTRSLYEAAESDMEACGYCYAPIVDVLPRMDHFTEKKGGAQPYSVEIDASESVVPSAFANELAAYIYAAAASGSRVFISLEGEEELRENKVLESARLRTLLEAVDSLPLSMRKTISFAFSVEGATVRDDHPLLGKTVVTVYHGDLHSELSSSGAIFLKWAPGTLELVSPQGLDIQDYAYVRDLADEIDETSRTLTWMDVCAAVAESRKCEESLLAAESLKVTDLDRVVRILARETDSRAKAAVMELVLSTVRKTNDVLLLEKITERLGGQKNITDAVVGRITTASGMLAHISEKKEVTPCLVALVSAEMKAMLDARLDTWGDEEFSTSFLDVVQGKCPGLQWTDLIAAEAHARRYLRLKFVDKPFEPSSADIMLLRSEGVSTSALVESIIFSSCRNLSEVLRLRSIVPGAYDFDSYIAKAALPQNLETWEAMVKYQPKVVEPLLPEYFVKDGEFKVKDLLRIYVTNGVNDEGIRRFVIEQLEDTRKTKGTRWYWDRVMMSGYSDCDIVFRHIHEMTVEELAAEVKENADMLEKGRKEDDAFCNMYRDVVMKAFVSKRELLTEIKSALKIKRKWMFSPHGALASWALAAVLAIALLVTALSGTDRNVPLDYETDHAADVDSTQVSDSLAVTDSLAGLTDTLNVDEKLKK